ncbi:MAG: UDP-glucose 4-epimerase GalE [Flavobacteriales bacterium]|nr:UDP-glucose 4-epimerase GalE [Flavobacteriales bacterium]|tara:strand:+ start:12043 stop:13044 length:1002 start_codon:yes stop_codon:yes gene_type:complete
MILVAGGAGYIGSHAVIELYNKGYDVLIADNFSNSSPSVLDKLELITGKRFDHITVDLCDLEELKKRTKEYKLSGVIHFAAYKSVGESVSNPLKYYANNLQSLVNSLKLCKERDIRNFVFSSSCTVYGNPNQIPVTEKSKIGKAESPYGKSKVISEEIIQDYHHTHPISICNLRYFNPIGAHESGLIGDYPDGKPNNLLPFVTQVAAGVRDTLSVFGDDYDTHDGTCLRDYIHVVDLAKAHVNAIEYNVKNEGKHSIFNLGTGKGVSVLDLIKTFEKVNNVPINYEIVSRRPGDVEAIFADCHKAKTDLNWIAELNLSKMLTSAWKFQQNILK